LNPGLGGEMIAYILLYIDAKSHLFFDGQPIPEMYEKEDAFYL
jgi:hypothetical protein